MNKLSPFNAYGILSREFKDYIMDIENVMQVGEKVAGKSSWLSFLCVTYDTNIDDLKKECIYNLSNIIIIHLKPDYKGERILE